MGWVLLYIKRPGKSSELGWVGLGLGQFNWV